MSQPAATLSASAGSSLNSSQVRQRAAAEVVDEHRAALVRQRRQLLERRLGREPDDAVVARVHAQDRARALGPGGLEVLEVGAVGGADLDQLGAALAQDVGDAEAVADLDELAAGDEHLAAARRGGERQQDGRGVVVDDERVLGAGDGAEHVVDVVLARGAFAARQAVLEVRVAHGGGDDGLDRRPRQQRAPQVGVHDDAGRVDDAPQRRRDGRLEQAGDPGHEGGRREVRRLGGGRLAGLPPPGSPPAAGRGPRARRRRRARAGSARAAPRRPARAAPRRRPPASAAAPGGRPLLRPSCASSRSLVSVRSPSRDRGARRRRTPGEDHRERYHAEARTTSRCAESPTSLQPVLPRPVARRPARRR